MHPIERLRFVARATGADTDLLARETAGALAGFADDPAGLVMACRRIVARHPLSGPLWWLCSRVLVASDPVAEAWRAADELDADHTGRVLVDAVPDGARLLTVGWSGPLKASLGRRGDLTVLTTGCNAVGRSRSRVDRWWDDDVDEPDADAPTIEVPAEGIGGAAADADVVALEASAAGIAGFIAPAGSYAAAAVAHHEGREVWIAAGVGRYLPPRVWERVERGLDSSGEPWERSFEVVPSALVNHVVGPSGLESPAEAVRRTDCPVAPELLRG
jgi:hypothetical protein